MAQGIFPQVVLNAIAVYAPSLALSQGRLRDSIPQRRRIGAAFKPTMGVAEWLPPIHVLALLYFFSFLSVSCASSINTFLYTPSKHSVCNPPLVLKGC